MDKQTTVSDSEDEAFESADEGDVDNGPSPKRDESGESKDAGKEVNPPEESQEQGVEDAVKEKEQETEKEKVMNFKEESKNGSVKEVGTTSSKEEQNGDKTNSDQTASEIKAVVKEVSTAGVKSEEIDADNKSTSNTKEGHAEEKDNLTLDVDLKQGEEPTEPKVEQIHESAKATESQSPILQAMDRLADGSDANSSSTVTEEPSTPSAPSSWGWGGWGSMLSKATSSVSSMLETVETQLGIPSPTDMAKLATASKSSNDDEPLKEQDTEVKTADSETTIESTESKSEKENESASSSSGLGSWLSGMGMSHLSAVVQNTGKEIVSGGLDALEFVGKKTIDAISHGDPGFRRKRMTLSQAIREAKEKAEQSSTHAANDQLSLNAFSVEFDRFQGLAHLEALEMISRESEHELEKLLESRPEESIKDSDDLLAALKDMFQVNENEDDEEEIKDVENFEDVLSEQVSSLSLSVAPAKLISAYNSSKDKSEKQEDEIVSPEDLYSETITCFAEMTARSVEIFHKIGELMLLPDVKASFLAKTRGNALSKICSVLRASMSSLSTKFATKLNERKTENDDAISKIITDIYLEASNSSSHIADSFHLLLPILQLSAIKIS